MKIDTDVYSSSGINDHRLLQVALLIHSNSPVHKMLLRIHSSYYSRSTNGIRLTVCTAGGIQVYTQRGRRVRCAVLVGAY